MGRGDPKARRVVQRVRCAWMGHAQDLGGRLCFENPCAGGTLECGGLTPPGHSGLRRRASGPRFLRVLRRRRQAAALHGAARIFMLRGARQPTGMGDCGVLYRAGSAGSPSLRLWLFILDNPFVIDPLAQTCRPKSRRVPTAGTLIRYAAQCPRHAFKFRKC